MQWKMKSLGHLLELVTLCSYMVHGAAEEAGECREQEYQDRAGNCVPCRQCGPGQELSLECGFSYGEGARCVPCRPGRFKDGASAQKCKPCLACAHVNRLQRTNCTATSNAVCGDCLSGFFWKTKLSGFQDMECVPCGVPPPAHEPHCSSRVNLVPLLSVASSPRDTALAAVICSALASVLLALLLLCAIYCKRRLERKPPQICQEQQGQEDRGQEDRGQEDRGQEQQGQEDRGQEDRGQEDRGQEQQGQEDRGPDGRCYNADFSCFDHIQFHHLPHTCHHNTCGCYQDLGHNCGPVKLLPSQCSEEPCSVELSHCHCLHCSQTSYGNRSCRETFPGCQEIVAYPVSESQTRPQKNTLPSAGNHDLKVVVSGQELPLEDGTSVGEKHSKQASDSSQDLDPLQ